MPRQARLDAPGALHHIMVRGIDKTDIFADDRDKIRFLERLGENVTEGSCSVYAWVLMDNHVHLLFKSGKYGISAVMRKLLTWYAQYFNRRHNRIGHLFQNRYKSILCDEESYLLALIRYIHLNPVRAQIVKTIEELDRYPWSGHSTIIGKSKHVWMDTDGVLSQFDVRKRSAISGYRRFVMEEWGAGRRPELTGGGLSRSQGGWSQVLTLQRSGQKEEFDERVLGSGDFVHTVMREAEERQLRQTRLRMSGKGISDIIREECKKSGVNEQELVRGSRRLKVSRARAGIVKTVDELDTYPYGGHSVILGKIGRKWQDRDYVLRRFGEREGKERVQEIYGSGDGTGKSSRACRRRTDQVAGGLVSGGVDEETERGGAIR